MQKGATMNRNYKSLQFMQAINPLLSAGLITGPEAGFLVKEYREGKDNIIYEFVSHIKDVTAGSQEQIFALLEQKGQ